MNRYYVNTGTVTYAIKCRDILIKNGYKAFVKRNDINSFREGCGYSVIFEGDTEKAMRIIRSNNIKISSHGTVSERR